MRVIRTKTCKWCDNPIRQRVDRPSESCSNNCRYAAMNLCRWMRTKQQRYKGKLEPLHQGYSTWDGWAANTARQQHKHKRLSKAQLWAQRCHIMVQANKHRITKQNSTEEKSSRIITWDDAARTLIICLTRRSHKCRWTAKAGEHGVEQQKATKQERTNGEVTSARLKQMIKANEYRCMLSGVLMRPHEASLDHVQPLSKGGKHDMGNVKIVHQAINRMKGTMDEAEFINWCTLVSQWNG